MNHPFALELSDLEAVDLDFEEHLTAEEATQVGGSDLTLTTLALGEEGGSGDYYPPYYSPYKPPYYPPYYPPYHQPPVYTKALWENGGEPYIR